MALVGGVKFEGPAPFHAEPDVGGRRMVWGHSVGTLKRAMTAPGIADADRVDYGLTEGDVEDLLHGAGPEGGHPKCAVAKTGAHRQRVVGDVVARQAARVRQGGDTGVSRLNGGNIGHRHVLLIPSELPSTKARTRLAGGSAEGWCVTSASAKLRAVDPYLQPPTRRQAVCTTIPPSRDGVCRIPYTCHYDGPRAGDVPGLDTARAEPVQSYTVENDISSGMERPSSNPAYRLAPLAAVGSSAGSNACWDPSDPSGQGTYSPAS